MDEDDYFYSLLYHGLYQKEKALSEEYFQRLKRMNGPILWLDRVKNSSVYRKTKAGTDPGIYGRTPCGRLSDRTKISVYEDEGSVYQSSFSSGCRSMHPISLPDPYPNIL